MWNRPCPRISTSGVTGIGNVFNTLPPERPLLTGSSGANSPSATAPGTSGRDEEGMPGIGLSSSGFRRDSFHILIAWNRPSRAQPAPKKKGKRQTKERQKAKGKGQKAKVWCRCATSLEKPAGH